MNHISSFSEYSHKVIAGVKNLFGYYCPLCKLKNHSEALCAVCNDLVLLSINSHNNRCQCCMIQLLDNSNYCQQCSNNKPSFEKLIAAFDYQPYGDLLIYKYKVEKQFWLASLLADLLYQAIIRNYDSIPNDLILIPVPASQKSLSKRGFNPPGLITKILARKLSLKYAPDYLLRMHDGIKQAKLSKEQRAINTSHLYKVNNTDIKNAKIVIVDDVFTTGSTLNSISKKLLHAGAQVVHGWVLARTPSKNQV